MRFQALALFALPLLYACASLSEAECRAGDWREIGREDGATGRTADFINAHAKACSEFGIRPDTAAWEQGRQEGLLAYCTPRNAYREGTRGRSLSPVCSGGDLARLTEANDRGFDLFHIERRIDDSEREMSAIRAALSGLSADDPSRRSLQSELSFLNLRLLRLRTERNRLRYNY